MVTSLRVVGGKFLPPAIPSIIDAARRPTLCAFDLGEGVDFVNEGWLEQLVKIRDLSLDERIRSVEDIWDSIADEQESLGVTQDQRLELDRRADAFRVSNEPGTPAAEAIERIRADL